MEFYQSHIKQNLHASKYFVFSDLKQYLVQGLQLNRGADKSLVLPTSRCILFDDENISFDASLVIYIYIYIYI